MFLNPIYPSCYEKQLYIYIYLEGAIYIIRAFILASFIKNMHFALLKHTLFTLHNYFYNKPYISFFIFHYINYSNLYNSFLYYSCNTPNKSKWQHQQKAKKPKSTTNTKTMATTTTKTQNQKSNCHHRKNSALAPLPPLQKTQHHPKIKVKKNNNNK